MKRQILGSYQALVIATVLQGSFTFYAIALLSFSKYTTLVALSARSEVAKKT